MATISYINATCVYPGASAPSVDDLNLEVEDGEFMVLVGPSGSGKSTALRMLAGLEPVSSGEIRIDGTDVSDRAPKDRNIAMVFQNYALYPHMSVADNMGFALKLGRVPKPERELKIREAAALLDLEPYLDRKPKALSGGQRQRVALARAIVNEPPVLLLDEPLGALDLKLRQEMQVFLKALQRELGITFVYVTHDQEEALTMSDRLAVFNEGGIEQVGTPAEVYEHPRTEFVAGFVGVSNVLERDGRRFTIRPEKIRMTDESAGTGDGEVGTVREVVYVGMVTRYVVDLESGGELVVVRQNLETSSQEALSEQGKRVRLSWRPEHTYEIGKEGT